MLRPSHSLPANPDPLLARAARVALHCAKGAVLTSVGAALLFMAAEVVTPSRFPGARSASFVIGDGLVVGFFVGLLLVPSGSPTWSPGRFFYAEVVRVPRTWPAWCSR